MTATGYADFLASKRLVVPPSGFDCGPLPGWLFDFQRDIVRWALARGKAAIFAGTGLGKTPMQLAWAAAVCGHGGGDVLIVAPLAVARQTAREGAKFGVPVTFCLSGADVRPGVNVTNYERLHLFDPAAFVGVVLDESSILKALDGKTRTALIAMFAACAFRLACTATPAPNDFAELGNHAEFLGVMRLAEMLATFFVHDGGSTQDWRLKGHARDAFWRWVASWAVLLRTPSDLGYRDGGFLLPPLVMHRHAVAGGLTLPGMLFPVEALSLADRRAARKASLGDRVAVAAGLANASAEPWLIWCDLNAEGDALARAIPGAVQVAGSDPPDAKEARMLGFADGAHRVLISKPSICGFGMNWQHCANVCFVGLSDSWERYYQAIRRCWRFGQRREVHCHIVASEAEGAVLANIERKERDAAAMAAEMVRHMQVTNIAALTGLARESEGYDPTVPLALPGWLASEAA